MKSRADIAAARCWVLKIGSSLLTADGAGLDRAAIIAWVAEIAKLRQNGVSVVVVSSGAVAAGMSQLGWSRRPEALHELQAAAAVGQMSLIQAYETAFQAHGLHTAQILLTHDDLSSRQRYLNARTTLATLLQLGVVPIINENDTVATDEIRLGDNDTLAALVTNLVGAELMLLLTDQAGLFDADPRLHPTAQLLSEASAHDARLEGLAGGSISGLGRGGMQTKVRAARLAARSGGATLIASGRQAGIISQIAQGETVGTLLIPSEEPWQARKRWLAGQLQVRGRLVLDAGAVRSLREQGSSLLAVGVTAVEGEFQRGELVTCMDAQGQEQARGLVNYPAAEAHKIMGQSSSKIAALLGYVDAPELIHRDNLVII
jgi:glutamate 5-kinase